MRIRVQRRAASAIALVLVVLIGCSYYVLTGHHRVAAQARPAGFRDLADALQSTNAPAVLAAADHFYWLNNGTAAGPLYARAEKLFSERGDAGNELHAKVGRLRSEAETMSFVELSRLTVEQVAMEMLPMLGDGEHFGMPLAQGFTYGHQEAVQANPYRYRIRKWEARRQETCSARTRSRYLNNYKESPPN